MRSRSESRTLSSFSALLRRQQAKAAIVTHAKVSHGYRVSIDFAEVRPRPLAAQRGGTFLTFILPRVDMLKNTYLLQTYYPARALFLTEDTDKALAELEESSIDMTMSIAFPGKVIDAPDATAVEDRTALFRPQ